MICTCLSQKKLFLDIMRYTSGSMHRTEAQNFPHLFTEDTNILPSYVVIFKIALKYCSPENSHKLFLCELDLQL
jgi:hypothetical protein